jgi:hypothetical protein
MSTQNNNITIQYNNVMQASEIEQEANKRLRKPCSRCISAKVGCDHKRPCSRYAEEERGEKKKEGRRRRKRGEEGGRRGKKGEEGRRREKKGEGGTLLPAW